MRFWIREIMGILLVLAGLYIFVVCLAILLVPEAKIFEAMILSIIGIFVFRGGIHLLKVAVAARVAMRVETEVARPPAEKPTQPRKTDAPWDW
jgi:hypothetical protein